MRGRLIAAAAALLVAAAGLAPLSALAAPGAGGAAPGDRNPCVGPGSGELLCPDLRVDVAEDLYVERDLKLIWTAAEHPNKRVNVGIPMQGY